ncbi:MAG: GNAT family N-acetyltransferase [Anaerolineae bacterium]|nr:GNAT family N-acetyltransferase [Anaerolineae bacterium]
MIVYTNSLEGITADHLRGGFFAGWSRTVTPETHLRTLQGADGVVLAIDDATGSVVGYITMITDGVLSAFIPNIEVLAAYQGQGIGSELMRRMFDKLKAIPNIDLMCDPAVQPFYTRFGMQALGGMAIRKRDIDINKSDAIP